MSDALVVVGLSHRSTPLEVRERLALPRDAALELASSLLEGGVVGECCVLSTCNRVEVYAAPSARLREADALERVSDAIRRELSARGGRSVSPHLRDAKGPEAVRHLFRVASSLDSLVVGEPQILGQLKDAFEAARAAGVTGPVLEQALARALRVGRKVRGETEIGAGQVSVPSVAVELARQIFGDLDGRVALLVGAGEMAETAARLVSRAGARVRVVNRSLDRARALALELGPEVAAHPWSELELSLGSADIVITSTASPTPVITHAMVKRVQRARRGRGLFFIDIAVPRDVEGSVNDLDNVFLYDVDDLSQIVSESLHGRAEEARAAEGIVHAELESYLLRGRERALATPVVVGLRNTVRGTLLAELDKSLAHKLRHLGEAERSALVAMVDAATNKLLHGPTTRLKELAVDARGPEVLELVRDVFGLDESDERAPVEVEPREALGASAARERGARGPDDGGNNGGNGAATTERGAATTERGAATSAAARAPGGVARTGTARGE